MQYKSSHKSYDNDKICTNNLNSCYQVAGWNHINVKGILNIQCISYFYQEA